MTDDNTDQMPASAPTDQAAVPTTIEPDADAVAPDEGAADDGVATASDAEVSELDAADELEETPIPSEPAAEGASMFDAPESAEEPAETPVEDADEADSPADAQPDAE